MAGYGYADDDTEAKKRKVDLEADRLDGIKSEISPDSSSDPRGFSATNIRGINDNY